MSNSTAETVLKNSLKIVSHRFFHRFALYSDILHQILLACRNSVNVVITVGKNDLARQARIAELDRLLIPGYCKPYTQYSREKLLRFIELQDRRRESGFSQPSSRVGTRSHSLLIRIIQIRERVV